MRFVIQRVSHAQVAIDGSVYSEIEKGFLVLVGVCQEDTREVADKMVRKLIGLRIFEDTAGKTNLALKDVEGQLLLVSQFTLYADCRKGNRPSFLLAGENMGPAKKEKAAKLGIPIVGEEEFLQMIAE